MATQDSYLQIDENIGLPVPLVLDGYLQIDDNIRVPPSPECLLVLRRL